MSEKFNYVSPQYDTLLKYSMQKIGANGGWNNVELNKALREIITGGENGLFYPTRLLKALSNGQFPFIILLQVSDQLPDTQIDTPDSISLIPDPMQVLIASNGKKVDHAISSRTRTTTRIEDYLLLRNVQAYTRGLLMRSSIERDDLESKTVAIAKTILPTAGGDTHSLSFGYPYREKLRQIEMGSYTGLRR